MHSQKDHVVLNLLGLCFEDQTSSIACMALHRKIFNRIDMMISSRKLYYAFAYEK